MRRWGIHAAIATLASLGGGVVSTSAADACISRPANLSHGTVAPEGGNLKVKAGTIVYVVLGEPEKYLTAGDPKVFPWLAPTSSSASLVAEKVCATKEVSTLPERVFAFRAGRAGSALLSASLAPAWLSAPSQRRRGLYPFRSFVTVTG